MTQPFRLADGGLIDRATRLRFEFDGARYEGQAPSATNLYAGTAVFPDGGHYTGQWRAGHRNGKGQFTLVNGDFYDGEWQADKRQGPGIYTFANGDKMASELEYVPLPDSVKALIRKQWGEMKDASGKQVAVK